MLLSIDITTVIFQIINFCILGGLLYWLLFKPMQKTLRERAAQRAGLVAQLEVEQEEAERLNRELEERLANLEQEFECTADEIRQEAEKERAQLLQDAQAEVEQVLVEAQADAYRVRQQAVESFHEDLVDAILDVSGIVIGNVIPGQVHGALVRQLSDRIWELGRTDIQRVELLRQSLGQREPTAYITAAQSLTVEEQGLMARTLTALADRHVDLEVRVDPALVAGIRVRIGDIIVDSSIAGQMDELRGQAMSALEERVGNGEPSPVA
jgi:F0F1-type ATP synthase membrane subunit b/b'